jgi:diguanylate cyclase (GGDEF)-like protein
MSIPAALKRIARPTPTIVATPVEQGEPERGDARTLSATAPLLKAWGRWAGHWLRFLTARLRRPVVDDRALHELADIVEQARALAEIESALVRLACEISGAGRAELLRGEGLGPDASPRQVACWTGVDDRAAGQRWGEGAEGPRPWTWPVRCGDHSHGILRVFPAQRRSDLAPELTRRLQTLCTLTAAAGRGWRAARLAPAELDLEAVRAAAEARLPGDPKDLVTVRDSPFLSNFLPYAVAQAQRHGEPLSLCCLAADRLAGIQALLGPERAGAAVRQVAETVARTLRASDVVARLDDGRVVAILANAGAAVAVAVAEVIRAAIAVQATASDTMPALTVSIGVAAYPHDADDAHALLAVAAAALATARAQGRNRVASASHTPAGTARALTHCAG